MPSVDVRILRNVASPIQSNLTANRGRGEHSMKKREIEQWARDVIAAIELGQRDEDARVEVKAIWPDVDKAMIAKTARQIAAHANAANGETILWLFGVVGKPSVQFPNPGVVGVETREFATWYSAIESW